MKNIKSPSMFVLLAVPYGVHASFFWSVDSPEVLQEDIEKTSLRMSIPRPARPFNGQPMPNRNGVLFNGQNIYFNSMASKRAVIEALTGQGDNLDIDVIQHSVITREDFDNLGVTVKKTNELFRTYLLSFGKGRSVLEVSLPEFIVILNEQGKAFGLSDEEILEKINSSLRLEPTE
jgi:hypothetical protein